MHITNYLINNSFKYPNKISYVYQDQTITNRELYENVKNISFNLIKNGVKKGDTIALILRNSIYYPQIFLAAAYLDLNIAPLNPLLSKNDIIVQLNKLNIKTLFSWSDYLKTINFKKLNLTKKNCYDINSKSNIFQNFNDLIQNTNKKFYYKTQSIIKCIIIN